MLLKAMLRYLFVTVLLLACNWNVQTCTADSCTGCVNLDVLTFDKTIARFPFTIVKFDIAFPYGEKHEAYANFAKVAHQTTDELLIATLGIKDYGDNENEELGARFRVYTDHFPAIFLFKQNANDFERFPTYLDITVDNLRNFVTENTELFIGREGCVKQYEALAKNFANLPDDQQIKLTAEAEAMIEQLTKPAEQKSAKNYVIFMRKITDIGYTFVGDETTRLQRLRSGKVSKSNQKYLTQKLNILESFRVNKLTKQEKAKEDL